METKEYDEGMLTFEDRYPGYEDEMEEQYQEKRAYNLEWLSDHGLSESDVMEDEQGEYVYLDDEDGLKKTYIPFANEIDFTF